MAQWGINRINVINLQEKSADIENLISNAAEVSYGVCPFTIILGALNTTEAGYKPPYSIVNNYVNFQKVFTGREGILALWDNCYESTQKTTPIDKGGDETNNYGTVTVRQCEDGSNGGDRFYGKLSNASVSTTFNPSPGNESMTGMSAEKTVTLIFHYKDNQELFDKLTNNLFKLWMIPELFVWKDEAYKTQPELYRQYDHQWYYITACDVYYKPRQKNPMVAIISFTSLNDKIGKSGMAINQYVHFSGPGDVAYVPWVDPGDKDKKIVCDPEYLTPKPITHCQINLYGSVAFSNISFLGRKIAARPEPQYSRKIDAPMFIFPYQFQASSYDEIQVNAVAETNYYSLQSANFDLTTSWQDWKQKISSTYNNFSQQQYEGFITSDYDETTKTNKTDETSTLKNPYWAKTFLNNNGFNNSIYLVSGCEYFWIDPSQTDTTGKITINVCGLKSFNPSTISNKNFANWNLFNFFLCKPWYQLPLTQTQFTPVALSSFPIIGGFLNYLLLGLPVGFKLEDNVGSPQLPAIPLLYSCDQYELQNAIWGSDTAPKGQLCLDGFRKDSATDIYSICGTTSQTTSFAFSLTSLIDLYPTVIDGKGGKTGEKPTYSQTRETIEAIKLGQIKYATETDKNNYAYLLEPTASLKKPQKWEGFAIDAITFQTIGQVNYKITFYSQPNKVYDYIDTKNAVWTGYFKTLSNASQNTRQWTNYMILNNPNYNFKDNFFYPQNSIIGPTPKPSFVKVYTMQKDTTKYSGLIDIPFSSEKMGAAAIGFWKTSNVKMGTVRKYSMTNENLTYQSKTYFIPNIVKNETFIPKTLNVDVDTPGWQINLPYSETQSQNLSIKGDYWLYIWEATGPILPSTDNFPFWAQPWGKYSFDWLACKDTTDSLTIDLTNTEPQVFTLDYKYEDTGPFVEQWSKSGAGGFLREECLTICKVSVDSEHYTTHYPFIKTHLNTENKAALSSGAIMYPGGTTGTRKITVLCSPGKSVDPATGKEIDGTNINFKLTNAGFQWYTYAVGRCNYGWFSPLTGIWVMYEDEDPWGHAYDQAGPGGGHHHFQIKERWTGMDTIWTVNYEVKKD